MLGPFYCYRPFGVCFVSIPGRSLELKLPYPVRDTAPAALAQKQVARGFALAKEAADS